MSVEYEFQKAVYTALSGNGAVAAAVVGIYDIPPQAGDSGAVAAYPCLSIGAIVASEDDTSTELGFEIIMRIHTWSASGSLAEARNIQGLVYNVLHRASPAVTGYSVINLTRRMSDIVPDPNGVHHGVCEYRALVQTN